MRKAYTLLFSLMLLCNSIFAQKIIYSQDFDGFSGYNIRGGWKHEFTGCVPWFAGVPYQVVPCIGPLTSNLSITNKVAGIPDCTGFCAGSNKNVFMYSPPIDLSADTGVWLRYDSYFAKDTIGGHVESATVEVSTDSGDTWTIVQDVPANRSLSAFETQYINLSAYNHAPAIWIGFRYMDDSVAREGWAIDNMEVFVPVHKDLQLLSVTPNDTMESYAELNTGIVHKGVVYNAGLDTVHQFVVKYRQDGASVWADTITGVSIPAFHTFQFTHSVPDTVTKISAANVTMWVELAGDTIHNNDTLHTSVRGTYFMPPKLLALEAGESTINFYSPKAWYYMNQLSISDYPVCQISVHAEDTMGVGVEDYSNYLYYLHWNSIPFIMVDRRKIELDSVFSVVRERSNYFGFARIDLDGGQEGDSLVVNAHVKPAVDLKGDIRLALVITQDDITGHDTAFSQRNRFYKHSEWGPYLGPMGGFENLPDTVASELMYYNFVARKIVPSPRGDSLALPTTMTHNVTYNYTFSTPINSIWGGRKLSAIVLLIDNDDSTILNCSKLPWYLEVVQPQPLPYITATLYPNPSNSYSNLSFTLQQADRVKVTVTDIMGRLMYTYTSYYRQGINNVQLNVDNFPAGVYLVNIATKEKRRTLKLEVLH